jgi:HEAT repeat protein
MTGRWLLPRMGPGLLLALAVLQACSGESAHRGRTFAEWQRDLESDSPAIRLTAVEALEQAGALGVPGLVVALGSTDSAVRWRGARALGRLGPLACEAVPAIGAVVARDSDREARMSAAESLGWIGDCARLAVPALVTQARDDDGDMRSSAALALGRIGWGDDEAVLALIESLKDPRADVRGSAATALGQMGPEAKGAVPALLEALQDARPLVRALAEEALRKIDDG